MSRRAVRTSIGVDGCAAGWVAVELDGAGTFANAWVAPSLPALLADARPDGPIGVDIPLGGVDLDWRHSDVGAQELLGPRRSTIFLVPPRPVWDLPTHRAASERCRALTGAGFSVQAWGLLPRMREAEAYRDGGPHELIEVHPELVFTTMAGTTLPGKKSWAGQSARRRLLSEVGIELPTDLGPAGAVAPDDLFDAAAVAWCAYRFGRGGAQHVPDPADQFDHRGRPVVIWY